MFEFQNKIIESYPLALVTVVMASCGIGKSRLLQEMILRYLSEDQLSRAVWLSPLIEVANIELNYLPQDKRDKMTISGKENDYLIPDKTEFLFISEPDLFALDNPIDLVISNPKRFSRIAIAGTPSAQMGESRIANLFYCCNRFCLDVTCPYEFCAHEFSIGPECLSGVSCPNCGLDEPQEAFTKFSWRQKFTGKPDFNGFYLNSFYNPLRSWNELIGQYQKYHEANDFKSLNLFCNTELGLPSPYVSE